MAHNELLVGTESGDIIFLSTKYGSILHRLDVSSRPVTCIQFLKKDLFVGCLEPALRLYDFDKKNLSQIYRISDEIRCMDSMWDYVFMGGKNGYLIRYGCKVLSFEFTGYCMFYLFFFCIEEKNWVWRANWQWNFVVESGPRGTQMYFDCGTSKCRYLRQGRPLGIVSETV